VIVDYGKEKSGFSSTVDTPFRTFDVSSKHLLCVVSLTLFLALTKV